MSVCLFVVVSTADNISISIYQYFYTASLRHQEGCLRDVPEQPLGLNTVEKTRCDWKLCHPSLATASIM